MTKLIRGKVVVEKAERPDELNNIEGASLTPLDLEDPDYYGEEDDERFSDTDLIPERDGATFATAVAPWVGAEQAWRRGMVPPPHEDARSYPRHAPEAKGTPLEMELTENDMETVLSSLPPARERALPLPSPMTRLLSYAAVAAVTMVVTWMVVGMESGSEAPASADPSEEAVAELKVASAGDQGDADRAAFEQRSATEANHPAAAEVDKEAPSRAERASVPPELIAAVLGEPSDKGNRGRRRWRAAPRRAVEPTRSDTPEAAARISVDASAEESADPAEQEIDGEPEPAVAREEGAPAPTLDEGDDAEQRPATSESEPDAIQAEGARERDDGLVEEATSAADAILGITKVERPGEETETPEETERDSAASISKELVREIMEGVAPAVTRCRNSLSGRVVVELVVSGQTGRVISSRAIEQTDVGATAGRCAAKAAALAKFPRFEKERLLIKYPFDL